MDQNSFVCKICNKIRAKCAQSPIPHVCLLCNKYTRLYERLYPNPQNAPDQTLFVLKCVEWEEFYRRTVSGGYTIADKIELEHWNNLD